MDSKTINNLIEASEHRVVDLLPMVNRIRSSGCLVTVVSSAPQPPDYYRRLIGKHHAIASDDRSTCIRRTDRWFRTISVRRRFTVDY